MHRYLVTLRSWSIEIVFNGKSAYNNIWMDVWSEVYNFDSDNIRDERIIY